VIDASLHATNLATAIKAKSLDFMRAALDGGANPDAIHDGARAGEEMSMLEMVLEWSDKKPIFASAGIGLLVEYGASLDPPGVFPRGKTPLICWLATGNKAAAIDLLLALGASTEVRDDDGDTALGCALWLGHEESVTTLMTHGASVNNAQKLIEWAMNNETINSKRCLDIIQLHMVSREHDSLAAQTPSAASHSLSRRI
jgi:hypothetical protein